jgi:hypothetical protein
MNEVNNSKELMPKYDKGTLWLDRLFPLLHNTAQFNLDQIFSLSEWKNNFNSDPEIDKFLRILLVRRYEYAKGVNKDDDPNDFYLYLTEKGRKAKELGGHFNYEAEENKRFAG